MEDYADTVEALGNLCANTLRNINANIALGKTDEVILSAATEAASSIVRIIVPLFEKIPPSAPEYPQAKELLRNLLTQLCLRLTDNCSRVEAVLPLLEGIQGVLPDGELADILKRHKAALWETAGNRDVTFTIRQRPATPWRLPHPRLTAASGVLVAVLIGWTLLAPHGTTAPPENSRVAVILNELKNEQTECLAEINRVQQSLDDLPAAKRKTGEFYDRTKQLALLVERYGKIDDLIRQVEKIR